MKNKILALPLIYFLFISFSFCQINNQEELILANKINKVDCYRYKISDSSHPSDSILVYSFFYNQQGKLTKSVYFDSSYVSYTYEYHYNPNNDLSYEEEFVGPFKQKIRTTLYDYDERGNVSLIKHIHPEVEHNKKIKVKYNKKNLKVKEVVKKRNLYHETWTYLYDKKDRLVEEIQSRDFFQLRYQHEYDKKGNKIKSYIINSVNTKTLTDAFIHDDQNKVKKLIHFIHEKRYTWVMGKRIKARKGDLHNLNIVYKDDGLISHQILYINGSLDAVGVFKYNRP